MAAIWADFGECIIQSLSLLKVPEFILPVDADLKQAIGTNEPLPKMQTQGFWNVRRPGGNPAFDAWVRQGIEVVPKTDPSGNVWGVGFRRIASANHAEVATVGDSGDA